MSTPPTPDTSDAELDRILRFLVRGTPPSNVDSIDAYRTWLADQLADLLHRVDERRVVRVRLDPEVLHRALGLHTAINVAEVRAEGTDVELVLSGPDFDPVKDGDPIPTASLVGDDG